MGISSIKGHLAAAFTAAIMAITPAYASTNPSTENLPETNITTTQFEAGQCYSDDQITEYLLQSGETQVMDLDKKGVVNVRQNTPFGPQVVPRRFNNEYNLTADADSWTIIEEKPNGDNCIVLQGTDLDYVSIDNRYFTQINDSPTPATSERERALNTMQERFGETVFLTGTTNSGQQVDITTSLRGSWSVVVSDTDGSNFQMKINGFDYSLNGPDFHDQFDIFHPGNQAPSDVNMVDIGPLYNKDNNLEI